MSEIEDDQAAIEAADEGYVCPECGETFKLAMHLGAHRQQKHGVAGSSPKKPKRRGSGSGGGRSRSESRHDRRARAIRETLLELVDFTDEARGRGHAVAEDLADVIRRDADKIASSLAWVAERFNPVAWLVDKTMGHGGVITVLRGFLGVGTWTLVHWRRLLEQREAERAEQALLAEEEGVSGVGEVAAEGDRAGERGAGVLG